MVALYCISSVTIDRVSLQAIVENGLEAQSSSSTPKNVSRSSWVRSETSRQPRSPIGLAIIDDLLDSHTGPSRRTCDSSSLISTSSNCLRVSRPADRDPRGPTPRSLDDRPPSSSDHRLTRSPRRTPQGTSPGSELEVPTAPVQRPLPANLRTVITIETLVSFSLFIRYLLGLLLPVGIRESEMPGGFLPETYPFGAHRGDLAHQGVGAQTPPDPVDAIERVTRIVVALRQLDRQLLVLKAE